ncbi:hypothetical protein QTP88_025865 [Uroleucon formosanum]
MSKRDIAFELHKPARKNYTRRRVNVYGKNDLWQADLVEMIPYSKKNKGYKYFLTVIDCFTKLAWATPLKSKSAKEVSRAMSKILLKPAPKLLQLNNDMQCVFSVKNKYMIKEMSIIDLTTWATQHWIFKHSKSMEDNKNYLKDNFETKEGELDHFLGIEIDQRPDGSIFIHQSSYCKRILERFKMEEVNVLHIPTDPQHSLNPNLSGPLEAEEVPYRESAEKKSLTIHWNAVKGIFKYLKGTFNYGLIYDSSLTPKLRGYSDADYVGDTIMRRSTSGFIFMMGDGIVAWCSQSQKSVALSTTEAEYIALSQSIQEPTWLTLFISDLLETQGDTPILYADNQSAIKLVKNPEYHKRTKHIDVRYHYIHEKFSEGMFSLEYVPSKEQLADILTKPAVPKLCGAPPKGGAST